MRGILVIIVIACSFLVSSSNAGFLSMAAKKGGGEVAEYALKKKAKQAGKKIALHEVKEKFGKETSEVVARVANKYRKDPDEFAGLILRYGDWLNLNGTRLETLVDFGARNGDAGLFLVKRFGYDSLADRGWMKEGSEEAISEAWRLVDPHAIGGSWTRLRATMNKAGINGPGRDFCEELFENRVKAGRIPGFKKGDAIFVGRVDGKRQGIDFIAPTKDGRVRIIEFGTGRKPASDQPSQMTWDWVRKNLAEYADNLDPNMKINLRASGYPNELLNAKNINAPNFPIEKFVSREFYAPEIDERAAKQLGSDVKTMSLL